MKLVARALGIAVGTGSSRRALLRGLDLELGPGEIVAVIGRSGAGKTTLLRTLLGLHPADEGTVELDGRALGQWPARERARRLAWQPQQLEPWADPSALALVLLGRTPHLGPFGGAGADDRARALAALGRVGIAELADRRLSSLSGGERQRVMIARMLASDAELLLLDEPTGALDVGHAALVMQCCAGLAEHGAGIVMAMHDLELARAWAQRVVCIGPAPTDIRIGPTAELLVPEVIEAAFDVRARWAERLVFGPR